VFVSARSGLRLLQSTKAPAQFFVELSQLGGARVLVLF
jgi:hypothetical protein